MGAELRDFLIAASAGLLLLPLSACMAGSTRERAYFAATERCQSYFRDEIERGLGDPGEAMELALFLHTLSKNSRSAFATLLGRSFDESKLTAGADNGVPRLSSEQRLSVYDSVSRNIHSVAECRELEAYVSTYLLADQLRLAALERGIAFPSSALGVDGENQDEVAKALLAALVMSSTKGTEAN